MKFTGTILALCSLSLVAAPDKPAPTAPGTVPIFKNETPKPSPKQFKYSDDSGIAIPQLISQNVALSIIDRFKTTYVKLGNPKIALGINQPWGTIRPSNYTTITNAAIIIDPATGLPISAAPLAPALPLDPNNLNIPAPILPAKVFDKDAMADQQTRREVERLFGRPLRMAGVNLIDSETFDNRLIPEIFIEVLIGKRDITIAGITGNVTYSIPDIQVTALRLSDARILGQATVMDLFPNKQQAPALLRNFDIRELTEATALMLLDDLLKLN
ncbi:MAG: hypothetical protein EXS24_06965 [Pedosphaera sp.]|nr:hypothetical protein [Pedosphaera sp.]